MSPDNCNGNGNEQSGQWSGARYLEHQVSNMDTLAGIAIKYGVEVADIRRLNNLVTDLQIFALETLLIPLPGRHPPSSPSLSNGSASPGDNCTKRRANKTGHSKVLKSLQSLLSESPKQEVSPAMSTLQKYYGLRSPNQNGGSDGSEAAVDRASDSDCSNDKALPKSSSISDLLSRCRLRSRKSADDFLAQSSAMGDYVALAESGDGESEKSNEKSVRRRSKAEVELRTGTSERLLKEENSSGISSSTRTKSASRTPLSSNSESGWLNTIPVGLGDSILSDTVSGVRKSSSTSSLQEQERSNSTSVWPTSRWNFKPDLQAFSSAAIARPIFDGLPRPITGRRKTALD